MRDEEGMINGVWIIMLTLFMITHDRIRCLMTRKVVMPDHRNRSSCVANRATVIQHVFPERFRGVTLSVLRSVMLLIVLAEPWGTNAQTPWGTNAAAQINAAINGQKSEGQTDPESKPGQMDPKSKPGQTDPESKLGQIGQPLTWSSPVPEKIDQPAAAKVVYRLQKTTNDQLFLTPNECFFPKLGLVANGESEVPDIGNLNGGKSYAWVEDWDRGESAQWAWWSEKIGRINFRVMMNAGVSVNKFEIRIGGKRFVFDVNAKATHETEVFRGEVLVDQLGKQDVELTCLSERSDAKLLWIQLAGDPIKNASVIRKRWRPAAAHTRFHASTINEPVRAWVMEMDAEPGTLSFYSPVTTPFGYYGPTWLPDGRVNTGFNFSLWSYGRGKEEPPIEQLSHLLAVGNPDATFGHFGHEGTGVKIRDWEPLTGKQGQSQVFALRLEVGETYHTYYSFYYDAPEKRWKLFGVGNQVPRNKSLRDLWVGSFVEVPGPPHVQRTGVYPRRMRYRGWVSGKMGDWHPIDQMTNGNIDSDSGLTHTRRGVSDAGWFYLETGGWGYREPSRSDMIDLSKIPSEETPEYLRVESARMIREFASPIKVVGAERMGKSLVLSVEWSALDDKASLSFHHGTKEGLTFEDRWEKTQNMLIDSVVKTQLTIHDYFDQNPDRDDSFFRLRLASDRGQFWTPNTWMWDASQAVFRRR